MSTHQPTKENVMTDPTDPVDPTDIDSANNATPVPEGHFKVWA